MKNRFLQIKRVLRAALFVLLLSAIGMTKGYAYDFSSVCVTGQTLYYNITDATNHYVELTCPGIADWNSWSGFDQPTGDVIVPDNVQYEGVTYTITTISNYAFYNCNDLTSLEMPNTVTSIGYDAFAYCYNLALIELSNSLTVIGSEAFYYCNNLTSLNLPNSLTLIGNYAFYDCYSLTSLAIPNSMTSIGEGTFGSCSSLISVTIGNSVASIGSYAFSGCTGLTSIIIPNSVTSIGYAAFEYCTGLISITIPSSVTYIESNPFGDCSSLAHIIVASDNAYYDSRENCNAIIETNTNTLMTGCKNTVIPNSVIMIGDWAFYDCYELTSVAIPNSVTSIGNYAFYNCYELTSIEIPNSVTTIGEGAFESCTGLTSLTMGNSVTAIGDYTFYGCNGLTSIEIPNTVTSIGSWAFYGCYGLTSIEIPSSVTFMDSNPFTACSGLEQIIVASDNAYYDSRGNCNAIINTGTNTLITGCKNNVIPDSVNSIGSSAFYECYNLASIEIPNSVTSIGSQAFYYCSGLTSATIGNSVTSIGSSAFYYCNSLTSLTIGNSVTSIGGSAFYGCSRLSIMTVLAETQPSVSYSAFNNVPTDIPVYVPCSAVEDYQAAGGWNRFTNIIGLCSGYVYVTVNPSDGGTVAGTGYYYSGEVCVLTATPNSGYDFANWTENGRVVSTDSEYTFYAHPTTLVANFCPNTPIVFADANVKALCLDNWDTNGDGELSYAEAAAVTNLGAVFRYNSSITSFDELQYFISLSSIDGSAFYNCNNLTSIVIPNSVTSIGNYAFYYCNNLASIEIPNSVTSLGEWALGYCRALTSIELPNSVTSMGYCALAYCSGLTSIEIPNALTSISSRVFSFCSGLTSIEIPSSVTSMGSENPFAGCNGLEQIIVASDNAYFDSRENCNAIINTSTNALVIGCKNTVIPNSVTSIGYEAFRSISSLTSIEIPNSVTSIGNYAFNSCSGLTSATIGNSVTSIGNNAFSYCNSLSSMTMFAETPPTLGNNSFYNVPVNIPVCVPCGAVEDYQAANGWSRFTTIMGMCSGEVTVTVNPSEGGTVTGAGYYTGGEVCVLTATANSGFDFTNWTENGRIVSTDPVYSFYAHPTTIVANFCSNSPIVFADANVKALCVANWDTDGDGELSYAEAAAVTDLGTVFRYKSSITSFDELQYFISLTLIGSSAFSNCNNLTSIILPNSLTSIGSYAFYYCYNLTSIELPNFVTTIGYYAFYNCNNLTSIELPNSLTSIGYYAFGYCSGLTSIEIPSSLTSIGDNPFVGCNGLEQITVASDNANYDSRGNCNAIINTSTNALVTGCKNTVIPNTVTSIGNEAFRSCGLTSIEIPNSVTSIGSSAFYYCSGLTSIVIPNSVISISYDAFGYCSSLTSITLGNSLTLIDGYAFYNCYNLTSIEIPNSVTTIGYAAFEYCNGLTSVTIGNSVTTIDNEAFYYCDNLTSLTIGSSVSLIGEYAFYGCSSLSSVAVLAETPPVLGSYAFDYVDNTIPVHVPCGTLEAYQNAVGWNEFNHIMELCPGTITVTASPVEGGTVTGGGSFDGGATCTISATANAGYYFLNWTENGEAVSSDAEYTFLVAGDRNLVANFFTSHWTAENYQNGMFMIGVVQIDGIEQTSPGLELGAFCNGECRGTELPVYEDGQWLYYMNIGGNSGDIITFSLYDHALQQELDLNCFTELSFEVYGLIGMDEPYVVQFGSIHTVSVTATEGGSVSGGGVFNYGNYCTVTATPSEGYLFLNWSNNGEVVSCNATYSFSVTEDVNLEAVFMLLEGTLVGTGGATNVYLPSYSWFCYTLSQQIYTPNEIGTSGEITTISYFNAGATKTRSYDIYMVYTDKSVFESNADWITVTEADRVFSGDVTMTRGYWTTIVLDTPFAYNGHSNLAIIIDDNSGYYSSPDMACRVYNANGYQAIRVYSDGTNYDPYNPSEYNGTRHSVKNQIIFDINPTERTYQLSQGWNWWSANLDITLDQLKAALVEALPGTSITIQSQTLNTSYNPNTHRWIGRLTTLDVSQMYFILINSACEITLAGVPINPTAHPVTIKNGVNWIGFPFSESMSVSNALAGFPAVNNDIIQSQTNNCVFIRGAWRGVMSILEPGQGYMLISKEEGDRVLIFETNDSK